MHLFTLRHEAVGGISRLAASVWRCALPGCWKAPYLESNHLLHILLSPSFSLEHRPFIQGCMTPKTFHYFILLGLSWNS